jgi:hypothetical protein
MADSGIVVSLWVANGNDVVVTSDTHWSPSTAQRMIWPWAGSPIVETNNWYYQTTARESEPGVWTLEIKHADNMITRPLVLLRGAPGSANPIRAIEWDGKRLLVNGRWTVEITPAPSAVRVGEEEAPGRFASRGTHWLSSTGQGFAEIDLGRSHRWWQLKLSDLHTPAPAPAPAPPPAPAPATDPKP